MRKSLIFTSALAVSAALMLVYLLHSSQPEVETPGSSWEPGKIVPEGLSIQSLRLENSNVRISMSYHPDKGYWYITEPIEGLPDMTYLKLFVSDLSRLESVKLIELHAKDPGRYQLDPPAGRIVMGFGKDHPDITLVVGKSNYNRDHYYAKLGPSDTVFLVSTDVKPYLDAKLNNFRSQALLLNNPDEMGGIEISILDPNLRAENPNALEPKLTVQKDEDGKPNWIIISPVQEAADFNTVKGFFFKLGHNAATDVIDVPDGNYAALGLDPPRARITLTFTNGSTEEILLGSAAPGDPDKFYVRNSLRPDVVVVGQDYYRALLNLHFRNPYLIDSKRRLHLDKIAISFPREPSQSFVLIEDPGEEEIYHFQDDPNKKTTIQLARAFYKYLRGQVLIINHQGPLPRGEMGLDPARERITLYEKDTVVFDVSVGDSFPNLDLIATYGEDHLRHFTFIIDGDPLDDSPPNGDAIVATPKEIERFLNFQRRRSD